jgi:hypothetical protein
MRLIPLAAQADRGESERSKWRYSPLSSSSTLNR